MAKKQRVVKRGGAAKRATVAKTVDDYFTRAPQAAHAMLSRMRSSIRSVVPREATEVISYGIPAFKHDVVLVWYAAFADHCSLFPTGAVLEAFEDELRGFKTSKGTVQFPLDRPLPVALVKKIVKARLAHAATKKRR